MGRRDTPWPLWVRTLPVGGRVCSCSSGDLRDADRPIVTPWPQVWVSGPRSPWGRTLSPPPGPGSTGPTWTLRPGGPVRSPHPCPLFSEGATLEDHTRVDRETDRRPPRSHGGSSLGHTVGAQSRPRCPFVHLRVGLTVFANLEAPHPGRTSGDERTTPDPPSRPTPRFSWGTGSSGTPVQTWVLTDAEGKSLPSPPYGRGAQGLVRTGLRDDKDSVTTRGPRPRVERSPSSSNPDVAGVDGA